jgi:4-hydroxy-2-oxoglutarate aldolase
LTQEAASMGADAVLVVNPSYYKNRMTHEALIQHFKTVADHSPIPVLIYNVPPYTGIDLPAETIAALAVHSNIVGMKDSGINLVKMGKIRGLAGTEFQIICGSAGNFLPALSIGAVGGIFALANIAPLQCLAIHQYFKDNKMERAREIQIQMIPLNSAVTSEWGIPGLKAAMDLLGLYGGPVRLPLLPVSEEIRDKIEAIIVKTNIKRVDSLQEVKE